MVEKKCVLFGYREGLWTVTFADKLYFEGDKRKALFFAAKLALMEEAGVIIEKNVPLQTKFVGAALQGAKSAEAALHEATPSEVIQPPTVQHAPYAGF